MVISLCRTPPPPLHVDVTLHSKYKDLYGKNGCVIYNGNRTEWSPIRSVTKRVITKSNDREAGVRFVITSLIKLQISLPKSSLRRFRGSLAESERLTAVRPITHDSHALLTT